MNGDDSKRVKYWNEDYVNYWKTRVAEANAASAAESAIIAGDEKTGADDVYLNAIALLEISDEDVVLELGCGFGRSLPTLSAVAKSVAAVDISAEMIREAKAAYDAENVSFHTSPSEQLPFESDTFDVVVCFAAFDAMYQADALKEMNRVAKVGARILVTGKNADYRDDDVAALNAEAGARMKGHPNYFTDFGLLIEEIARFGFAVDEAVYYPRRGDFAKHLGSTDQPEKFYEYLLVLRKAGAVERGNAISISDELSRTYRRVRSGESK